jgi:nucleoside phosphorylase
VAPMAAGENVIVSGNSPVYQRIRALYSDALEVEMEGRATRSSAMKNAP